MLSDVTKLSPLLLFRCIQVGNAFVNQYYNVLHQSPQVVHRFYTDASRLTRAEAGPDGAVDSVISQSVSVLSVRSHVFIILFLFLLINSYVDYLPGMK